MDLELQEAAYTGDVRFLRQAVATERSEYFLRRVEAPRLYYNDKVGNIIHIATLQGQQDFIKQVINLLPSNHLHLLFTQQEPLRNLQNPLHFAATRGGGSCLGIIKLILDFYRRISSSPLLNNDVIKKDNRKPWLARDSEGNTPLQVALMKNPKEECAVLEILSMDMELLCNVDGKDNISPLYLAVSQGCNRVALEILRFAPSYSLRGILGMNPLNSLPNSTEEVGMLLLEKHPELLHSNDKESTSTVIESWAWAGKLWPFKCLTRMKTDQIGQHWRSYLVEHLHKTESTHGDNPLHQCIRSIRTHKGAVEEDAIQVIQFLVEAHKQENNNKGSFRQEGVSSSLQELMLPPWYMQNQSGKTPLHIAIQKSERIAIYLLSIIDSPQHLGGDNPLVLAMELGRIEVVKKIIALTKSNQEWRHFVYCRGGNILHAAAYYKEDVGTLLVDNLPEHINERNNEGKTPLEVASKVGAAWLVKSILLKDPSSITKAPLAWIDPCKEAHIHLSTLKAFIEHCPNFGKLCLQQKDTPLHHLQLRTSKEYSDFLMIPLIRGMKNAVDSNGATPLHRAIERKDMPFVESLLMTNWVFRNIKDRSGKTALDMLAALCNQDELWKSFCEQKEIKLQPRAVYTQPQQTRPSSPKRRSWHLLKCFKGALPTFSHFDRVAPSSQGVSKLYNSNKKSCNQLEKEVLELLKRLKENMTKEEVKELLEANEAPLSGILHISEQQDHNPH